MGRFYRSCKANLGLVLSNKVLLVLGIARLFQEVFIMPPNHLVLRKSCVMLLLYYQDIIVILSENYCLE